MALAANANTDVALSKALGVASQAIYRARKERKIPAAWPAKLALNLNVSTDWIIFGKGSMERAAVAELPAEESYLGGEGNVTCVPLVKARLSPGSNTLEADGGAEARYAFRTAWLARQGRAESMVLMEVAGNSMSPALEDGDTVLIDQSQKAIIAGKIYAVALGDEVVVKILDKAGSDKVLLRSYNKDYAPFEVDMQGSMAEVNRIIGRVIWWCREA